MGWNESYRCFKVAGFPQLKAAFLSHKYATTRHKTSTLHYLPFGDTIRILAWWCSSLGTVKNHDSQPPWTNSDHRNSPEHLKSSLTWRTEDFWISEMNAADNSIFTSGCSSWFCRAWRGSKAWALHSLQCLDQCFQMCTSFQQFLNCWISQNFNCIKCKKKMTLYKTNI